MGRYKRKFVIAAGAIPLLVVGGCSNRNDAEPNYIHYFDIIKIEGQGHLEIDGQTDLFNVPPLIYPLNDSLIVQFIGGISCPPEITNAMISHTSAISSDPPELLLTIHDAGEQECTADLYPHTFRLTPTSDYTNSAVWSATPMSELAENAVWLLDSDGTQTFPFTVADFIVIND